MRSFIKKRSEEILQLLDWLPATGACRISLGVLIGALPAIAASFAGGIFSRLGVFLAIAGIYTVMAPLQGSLFGLSPSARYWKISTVVSIFFLAWAVLLGIAGHPENIARSVGPVFALAATAIWPVYLGEKAYSRGARKIPFDTAYGIAAGLAALHQGLLLGGMIWGR